MPAPKHHGFTVSLILFAVQGMMRGLTLRQVEAVLQAMGEWFGFDAPDHSTVRLWLLRVGLYLWQRTLPRADDWIWIIDHVAEPGGGKCLVIVGVRRGVLRGRDFVLQHTDVTLLYAETMQSSTGDHVYEVLVALAARVGVPVQIVSDHGSDVLKGARLFQTLNAGLVATWDITHRMARLLLAAVQDDATWPAFVAECQRTRQAVERTPWAALAPPSTAGASRCEHFDKLVLWAVATDAKIAAGAARVIDGEHRWTDASAYTLRDTLPAPEAARLEPLLDRSFPNEPAFTAAVTAVLGPSEHTATVVRSADQGASRCRQHYGWLEQYRATLQAEYRPLVEMVYSAEKQVKHAGLHGRSAADWRATQPRLARNAPRRVRRFRAAVLRYLHHEGRGRPREESVLATSDVLESLFGKYKRYTERSPQRQMNSAILTMPVATEVLTPELIKQALKETPLKHLQDWCREKIGRTKLRLQRALNALLPGTNPA